MFQRILVANRGEIALRIIRACREMGIQTVAVFSEADRGAGIPLPRRRGLLHRPGPLLRKLLADQPDHYAAEIGNVQAIHPGYGFLAENAQLAEVCRSCKIEFIGPRHEAMALLGDKVNARKVAIEAKVPVVPGSEGLVANEQDAIAIAAKIGYPVLIKATAGGGGKGMASP